jgi:hypothetical protein
MLNPGAVGLVLVLVGFVPKVNPEEVVGVVVVLVPNENAGVDEGLLVVFAGVAPKVNADVVEGFVVAVLELVAGVVPNENPKGLVDD